MEFFKDKILGKVKFFKINDRIVCNKIMDWEEGNLGMKRILVFDKIVKNMKKGGKINWN